MILLLFLLNFAHAPSGNRDELEDAVCTEMNISEHNLRVACQIERAARDNGIKNREFINPIVNLLIRKPIKSAQLANTKRSGFILLYNLSFEVFCKLPWGSYYPICYAHIN